METAYGVAGCVLPFLRPLLCAFTRTELALLLTDTYGYDQWHESMHERGAGRSPMPSTKRRSLTVVAVTRDGKMTLLQGELDRVSDWRKSESDAESVATVASIDDSDLLSLSRLSRLSKTSELDFEGSDRCSLSSDGVVRADGRALIVSSSICMSRGASQHGHGTVFSHAKGHLELRQDAMFHLIRHWSDCAVSLSVVSGHLHIHRKTKSKHQRFRLADFTGASVHRKRKTDFKVIFYGHKPLHFRAATQGDAELWIMALEYAKEFTWHLWP